MLKYLSATEQVRFHELQTKLSNFEISMEEQSELSSLVTKARTMGNERTTLIDRLKSEIAAGNVQAIELFTLEQLREVAATKRAYNKSPKPKVISKKSKAKSARGEPLICFESKSAGAKVKFTKGQRYLTYVPKILKDLEAAGTLVESLRANMTPAGTEYFATPEGQAEFSHLLKMIASRIAKPAEKK